MKRSIIILIILFLACESCFSQSSFYNMLADSAITLTYDQVIYDPGYYSIEYPNGDVPKDKGVCTDVIIRVYRKMGIDLQKEVHEDMKANFHVYPKNWGLTSTDRNIDPRRVPNLMIFFERKGEVKPLSKNPSDYSPGDIVCWDLGGGLTHIGIVANQKSADKNRHLIVHNIGAGQVIEDMLFNFTIIGHYKYKK